MARNSKYTKEIGDSICEMIATTELGLRAICKKHKVDYVSVKRWLATNEDFRTQYARCKEDQADHMADEIMLVVNEAISQSLKGVNSFRLPSLINAMRLKVDSLKWIASKLKPKKYGDKLDIEQTIKSEPPLFPDVQKNDSDK